MTNQTKTPTLGRLLEKLDSEVPSEISERHSMVGGFSLEDIGLLLKVSPDSSFDVQIKLNKDASEASLDGLASMLFYITNKPDTFAAEIVALLRDNIKTGRMKESDVVYMLTKWSKMAKEYSDIPVIKSTEVLGITDKIKKHAYGN